MALAYCVLSHRNPAQIDRLVERIRVLSPAAVVLVHHDPRGAALMPTAAGAAIPSHPAEWGRWSMVEAMLRLFTAARAANADGAVLISGQDYPVAALGPWEDGLFGDGADAVLEVRSVEPLGPRGTPPPTDDRYLRTWLRWRDLPPAPTWARTALSGPWLERARGKVLNRVQPQLSYRVLPNRRGLIGVRRRATPFDDGTIRCYWGSQWMALSRAAIEALLAAPQRQPELHDLFRTSLIPDESYVQTVLMAAGVRVTNGPVTYCEWTGAENNSHPAMVDADVLSRARRSRLPFARKFDLDTDPAMFDVADQLTA